MKTPEEIYDKIKGVIYPCVKEDDEETNFEDWFISELKEYGKQQYNQAIEDFYKTKKLCDEIIKIFHKFFDNFENWEYGNGANAGKDFKRILNLAKKIKHLLNE